jgi:hypothetical protein
MKYSGVLFQFFAVVLRHEASVPQAADALYKKVVIARHEAILRRSLVALVKIAFSAEKPLRNDDLIQQRAISLTYFHTI